MEVRALVIYAMVCTRIQTALTCPLIHSSTLHFYYSDLSHFNIEFNNASLDMFCPVYGNLVVC